MTINYYLTEFVYSIEIMYQESDYRSEIGIYFLLLHSLYIAGVRTMCNAIC